jgi:uncharacterized protein (TIGR03435 family)
MSKVSLRGIGAGLLLAAGAAFAQTPAAPAAPSAGPTFEVASVKLAGAPDPARMMSGHVGMKVDGARVDIGFLSLSDLIAIAYRVKAYQISGPDWMSAQRFDIMAKLPAGASQDQAPEMLQALLAERFKLTIHRANKDIQIYALVAGKNGPKLKESAPDEPTAPAADGAAPSTDTSLRISGDPQKGMTVSNGLGSGTVKITMANGAMHMESAKMSMTQFAEALSRFLDHPVMDMTEIKGNYQVALDLSMEDIMNAARSAGMQGPGPGGGGMAGRGPAEGASDPRGSSLFNNVQQLGLKLEARKAPVDLIVIDHLEKLPTEN